MKRSLSLVVVLILAGCQSAAQPREQPVSGAVTSGIEQITPATEPASTDVPATGLIKGSLRTIYYVHSDGRRYVFPNRLTFHTWYPDESEVMQVTDEQVARIPIGGNVCYRAGTYIVRLAGADPRLYWVGEGGVLRQIQSEADAARLVGPLF